MEKAEYIKGRILGISSDSLYSLYDKSRYGSKIDGNLEFSSFEALYLLEKSKLEIIKGKKTLDFESLLRLLHKKEDNFWVKFVVFRNFRDRGYIIKTALKFGADFRVYERGIKPGEDHAKWIVFPVKEGTKFTWHDFSAKNRVAHSTKKKLLIGVVDDESDVTYYEVRWVKP